MTLSNSPSRRFKDIAAEFRALEVLQVLSEEAFSAASNSNVLDQHLRYVGLGASGEEVEKCLDMLEQNGLVRLRKMPEVIVSELTDKGDRVAKGEEYVEGIARPSRDRSR